MSEDKAKYNPRDHFIKLKARKSGDPPVDYLPVAERVRWFRDEHPDGDIDTTVIEVSDMRAVMLVRVAIPNGGSATTIGSEHKAVFPDYIEKAATVALGRALAILGYGVGFTDEFEERRDKADKSEYEINSANVVRQEPTSKRFPTPPTNGGFVQPAAADPVLDKWLSEWLDNVGMSNPTAWTQSKAAQSFTSAGTHLAQVFSNRAGAPVPPNTIRQLLVRLHVGLGGTEVPLAEVGGVIDNRIIRAINQADSEALEMLRQLAGVPAMEG